MLASSPSKSGPPSLISRDGAGRSLWEYVEQVRPYFFGVKMVISPVECFLQVSLCLDASKV